MGLLRFILAVSVVIAHSETIFGYRIVGGRIAVQAFYIISGFYMTLILREKYIGKNSSYKLFISNRLLRLYPIYWVVLGFTVFASVFAYYYTDGSSFGKLDDYREYILSMSLKSILFLIVSNIVIVFQDLVMFLGLDISSGELFFTSDYYQTNPKLYWFLLVPQAWTISIEILFYVIAPFIVKRSWYIIVFLIVLSFGLRQFIYANDLDHDPWTYRFFPTELLFFLLGTLGYEIYKNIKYKSIYPSLLKAIFGFMLIFTLSFSFVDFQYKMILYFMTIFLSIPFVFLLSKNWKIDRFFGELSYPIYIAHILVIMIVTFLDLKVFKSVGLAVIIITIFFAVLLNKFVANKIEIYRQNRLQKLG